MRLRSLVVIGLLVLSVSCAGAKTVLLKSSQIAETSLGAAQDTFYRQCFGFLPTAATKPNACTAASGIAPTLYAQVDATFGRAFEAQKHVVQALQAWQPGQTKPTSVDQLVSEVNNALTAVQVLAPGAVKDSLVAAIQKVIADVATLVKDFGGK
jgi:hypothetical protein